MPFIASEYGLDAAPVTDHQVLEACGTRPDCESARLKYQSAVEALAEAAAADKPDVPPTFRKMAQHLREQAAGNKAAVVRELRDRGLLAATVTLPAGVEGRLVNRRTRFASKYDPFRLAVEHKALRSTRLEAAAPPGGKPHFVSFAHLDPDLSPETTADRAQLEVQATTLFQQLGLEDMGLIRQFDLCRFTFGYTRMESTPVLRDKRGTNMPVRMNLFPDVRQAPGSQFQQRCRISSSRERRTPGWPLSGRARRPLSGKSAAGGKRPVMAASCRAPTFGQYYARSLNACTQSFLRNPGIHQSIQSGSIARAASALPMSAVSQPN